VPFRESRSYVLVYERRSKPAGPCHGLLAEQLHEQVELLLEELLVVDEVEPEQGERFGQRAATDDELCTAVRHRVEGREVGIYAHRVLRAQHRDGSAETDAFGSAGDRRQHHVSGRVHEVGSVVLADVERIDPHRIGQYSLLDVIAHHDIRMEALTELINGDVAESVQAELELRRAHGLLLASGRRAAGPAGRSQGGVLAPTARTSRS